KMTDRPQRRYPSAADAAPRAASLVASWGVWPRVTLITPAPGLHPPGPCITRRARRLACHPTSEPEEHPLAGSDFLLIRRPIPCGVSLARAPRRGGVSR